MNGWVCLKALQELPGIKKGFALSTWDIHSDFKKVMTEKELMALAKKQIVMLDEHSRNSALANALKSENNSYFEYEVWQTDHPFTNKRVALIKMVLSFLDK